MIKKINTFFFLFLKNLSIPRLTNTQTSLDGMVLENSKNKKQNKTDNILLCHGELKKNEKLKIYYEYPLQKR